ncbi:phage terminase small subunit P27 family [Arthrobacter sp. GCM10027362]|uniref:phage terminase small subunit P27 family n=1 Tax=Arthrobacter sp. GCM10027362 TaxID=3273379 RepID=UPI00362D0517
MIKRPPNLKILEHEPKRPAVTTPPRGGLDWDNEPPNLAPEALAEWRRLAAVYATEPERFTEADRAGVTAYCSIWSDFRAAEDALNRDGVTVDGRSSADRGRQVRNPALQAKREASQQLRLWATALRLTPASRAQSAPEPAYDPDNPFA